MPRFITHEAVPLLSARHCTATGALLNWKTELTNTEPLLWLVINRMQADWLALPMKSRKPWGMKDIDSFFDLQTNLLTPDKQPLFLGLKRVLASSLEPALPKTQEALQRNCGGFLCCLDVFLSKVPKDFADKALVEIHKSFPRWKCCLQCHECFLCLP